MGLILYLISLVFTALLFVTSVIGPPIYYLSTFKWRTGIKKLNKYFKLCAISQDQNGNTRYALVLNWSMLKKGTTFMQFGNMDDTVSYCLGVNYYLDNLTKFGHFTVVVLGMIDPYHIEKALLMKFIDDKEAADRLKFFPHYHHIEAMKNNSSPELDNIIDEYLKK